MNSAIAISVRPEPSVLFVVRTHVLLLVDGCLSNTLQNRGMTFVTAVVALVAFVERGHDLVLSRRQLGLGDFVQDNSVGLENMSFFLQGNLGELLS